MHISRVVIENFRNFLYLEIDPFPSTAVIVGENGIGKSNLLFALRLVLDPNLPDSRRQLRPEDICEQSPDGISDGVQVRVVVDLTGFDDDPPLHELQAGRASRGGIFPDLDCYDLALGAIDFVVDAWALTPAPTPKRSSSTSSARSSTGFPTLTRTRLRRRPGLSMRF